MPPGKYLVRLRTQALANRLRGPATPSYRFEVAQHMRPTHLAPPYRVPVVRTVTVRHQNAGKSFTQQLASHLTTAGQPDQKHRHYAGHRHPYPGALVTLAPARLIYVRHRLFFNTGAGFLNRLSYNRRRSLLRLADRVHTYSHTKQVVHDLFGGALGQAIGPRAQRHRGVDAGTVGPTGNALGPGRARSLAAIGTNQLMPLIFGHHRLDRRNLDHLMTKRRGIVSP